MIDRDALVTECWRQNVEMNQLFGVEKYGSIGYDDVTRGDGDLMISNIPSQPRESAIFCFLLDVVLHLRLEGLVAIVVVTSLDSTVESILNSVQNIKLLFQKASHGHKVFHYQFSNGCNEETPL